MPALERVRLERDTNDIALIVKYIGNLDPSVAIAAMQALRTFGRDALQAVENLDPSDVDANTRKDVVERLLKDHIYNCCRRDGAINPFHLDFKGRFDELYSVHEDIDELMFRMLRDSISDIREDISGNRYWNYYNYRNRSPFVDYGALAVAALAKRHPERLMREMSELTEVESNNDYYYYYYGNIAAPVTIELAAFFARQGNTAVIDKLINDAESRARWNRSLSLGTQLRIASLQVVGLGEYEAALDRLNENIKQAGTALSRAVSQAQYLRARILMHLHEEGAALHALEESMEASDTPMALTLVDSAFKPLANERRYQTVLDYCRLATRRLDATRRPYLPGEEDEG